MYERIVNYDQEGKTEKAAANPSGHPSADSLMQKGPIYHAENGKRVRRQPTSAPGNSNLFRACIHGDQTVVTGSTVRMRLLQDVTLSGMKIPANTLFYGIATLGANRLDVVVSNLKVGDNLNPVSVVVFDNDAMEGLNLPNNLKASAAKRMEQGLVQNIDMPLSSIGTMASEVTSVVNATTQVAKQILNMSLSQVKVHLKSNYEMYIHFRHYPASSMGHYRIHRLFFKNRLTYRQHEEIYLSTVLLLCVQSAALRSGKRHSPETSHQPKRHLYLFRLCETPGISCASI